MKTQQAQNTTVHFHFRHCERLRSKVTWQSNPNTSKPDTWLDCHAIARNDVWWFCATTGNIQQQHENTTIHNNSIYYVVDYQSVSQNAQNRTQQLTTKHNNFSNIWQQLATTDNSSTI